MPQSRQIPGWLPPLFIGGLIRTTHVAQRPLWLDELISWNAAQTLSGATWLADLHPPTFSLLVALLSPLGSVFALRAPSFLAGCASIVAAWYAGSVWGGRRSAVLCAWFCAVSSPWVAYSQEGRPYAMAGLGVWLILWLLGTQTSGRVAFLVGLFGAIWTWTGMAVAGLLLGIGIVRQKRNATAHLAFLGWSVGSLPLVLGLLGPQIAALSGPPAAQAPAWSTPIPLLELFGWILLGPLSTGRATAGAAVAVGLAAMSLRHGERNVLPLALVPLFAFGVSHWMGWHPLGATRQCLVLTPPILLLLAVLFKAFWRPATQGLALISLAVATAASVLSAPGLPVVDVPIVIAQLPQDPGTIWVDARIHRAWQHYDGPQVDSGSWTSNAPAGPYRWIVLPASDGRFATHPKDLRGAGVVAHYRGVQP